MSQQTEKKSNIGRSSWGGLKSQLHKLKEVKNEWKGRVATAMQVVLDQHKIVRRAFYSGHFIGNHCHRYMVNNIYIERELTRVAVVTVGKRTQEEKLVTEVRAEAQQTQGKF